MESLVITWRELLIVVAVVLAVYVAEMLLLLRSRREGRRWKGDPAALQPRFEALESEIEQLREQLLHFREQLDQLKAASPQQAHASPSSPYSQAIHLAQQGADASEVAANCGISRGEAELIVAMHRAKGA
ncbi:MAG: DUF2802 domain-containing protein [Sulfuricella sp.]|jgi:hypothetical protein|nr:DUF2802 domain-containing protein [Sulfuricella sp.]